MEPRVAGEFFSVIRSGDSLTEWYGCVKRMCSGWLPWLSTVLEPVRFLRRKQRSANSASIKTAPTAPIIIPTKAPVESPPFDLDELAAFTASEDAVGVGVMVVVPVGPRDVVSHEVGAEVDDDVVRPTSLDIEAATAALTTESTAAWVCVTGTREEKTVSAAAEWMA